MISYVAQDFGINLIEVTSIDAGVDRAAQTFRARSATDRYAIKWTSGGSVAGLLVPRLLAGRGVAGVAGPRLTLDGRLWSEREGRRLSVVPWVGDRMGLDGGLDESQWRRFGEVLAATHALPVTAELEDVLSWAGPAVGVGQARAVDALLRGTDPADEIGAAVRETWLRNADRILTMAARLERMATGVVATTVCHTDAHLGNVLVGPGQVWLIDWDDAALSTPEHDLMFVLGGTYGAEHTGDRQRAWFFGGYGRADIDAARLAYWRGIQGLGDVAFLAGEAADVAAEAGWRSRAARMLAGNLAPGGLLAMAGA